MRLQTSGTVDVYISAEDEDDAAAIGAGAGNLSTRKLPR